ncbi:O-acetyl-ADP-ribose deacetylase [Sphingobium cloacae]|uniref:RNase III inhibitor n=1 Tax=Sphingobium cloacae TaxID=120107 RepID=A0A1E1F3Q4_9SPHN|nr:O-acetyl-ADP-ribose deacetylase [Sphingobium cloacae]BAV65137.1 RNase III inhibitor [Sphingobium cloacae]
MPEDRRIYMVGWARWSVLTGDITRCEVDAIVNAANGSLLGGGGVDGAIHRAAGPDLRAECRTLGECPVGEARITGAYRLPARHVIHAVGPVWRGGNGDEARLLASCYRSVFHLAREHGLRSLAFPAISTGAHGFPREEAATIAARTVHQELRATPDSFRHVMFVCFDAPTFAAFDAAVREETGPRP